MHKKIMQSCSKDLKKDASHYKDDMKSAGETAMVWGGKILALVKDVGAAYGAMTVTGFGQGMRDAAVGAEAIRRAKEHAALVAKVDAEYQAEKEREALTVAKEKASVEEEAAKKSKAAADAKVKKEKDAADHAKEWHKWVTDGYKKGTEAAHKLADKAKDRTDWTLADVAALDPNMLNRQSRWKIGASQDVEAMRKEARFQRLEGNDLGAKNLLSRSDQLAKSIGGLSAEEADPLGALREQAKEQVKYLQSIGATVEGNALRIIVSNSE